MGSLYGVGGNCQVPVEGGLTSASTWTSMTQGRLFASARSIAGRKSAECVTVVLQEQGKGATWMFEDAYAKHRHWHKLTYEGDTLESAVDQAVAWAEKFPCEFRDYQAATLPWLSKS